MTVCNSVYMVTTKTKIFYHKKSIKFLYFSPVPFHHTFHKLHLASVPLNNRFFVQQILEPIFFKPF